MTRYISGDELADAQNAHGMGVPLAKIAAHLRLPETDLRRMLGLPPVNAPQPTCGNADCDLWSGSDRLEGQL